MITQRFEATPDEPAAARLGLYHCLRHLATEAAVLDLPDVMLAIARAASMVRVAVSTDEDPEDPGSDPKQPT